ncbi:hypothetical protein C437_15381 [Haloarcula vallismortis ATCC 29715]|uniref:Uncharacterized protein n=1 Tax=Haloarcula vallismortis ATCC 29715 TaxID=662477 RepID=M0J1A3_HALVA|nr:hypothetical protein [Haloarcula vallismortis]EMA01814.1 hypothetical protein C437_15381 [Haloarcula vallismortis ATCC 29715]
MAELDFGDGSPNSVLNGTINFLNSGGSLGKLLQGSIFGVGLSISQGGINFIQSVFALLVSPLDSGAELVPAFFEATVIEPLGVLTAGAEASAIGIANQFGPFALPAAMVTVLVTFFIMIQFLEEEETPDFIAIPGFPDIPDIGPLAVGTDEEKGEDE